MQIIDSFRGEWGFLSNFHSAPVTLDSLTYPSAEAAFQAQKCASHAERVKYTAIRNPRIAKHTGRREALREDWENFAPIAMERVLRAKFRNKTLAARLLSTKDALLIEGNRWHDNRWGHCTCENCREKPFENRLGVLLMKIRAELDESLSGNTAL